MSTLQVWARKETGLLETRRRRLRFQPIRLQGSHRPRYPRLMSIPRRRYHPRRLYKQAPYRRLRTKGPRRAHRYGPSWSELAKTARFHVSVTPTQPDLAARRTLSPIRRHHPVTNKKSFDARTSVENYL